MNLAFLKHSTTRDLYARYLSLAQECPHEAALIVEREPFVGIRKTWADLIQRSDEIAVRLRIAGACPGARCAISLMDHPDTLPVLLALWREDCTAVLIDRAWGPARRQRVVDHSGATMTVTFDHGLDIVSLNTSTQTYTRHPLPDGTAMLGYTSGSTGDPKGIAFTHQKLSLAMQAASAAMVSLRGNAPRRIACSMRLSGSGVLNLHYIWAVFSSAAVVVLPELTFDTARDYWSRIEEHGIEQTFLVPTLIELLNHVAAPRLGHVPPPICLTGSAPLSSRTQDRFQRRFGAPLFNAYGLSETMCASFFGSGDSSGLATNAIGVPWLLEARLKDAEKGIVSGEGKGELELAGPTLFDGYFGNHDATTAAFDGRWFRTGDVARRDQYGRYTLVGRTKDVVMKGGYSVYLNEVEEAALDVSGVLEAAAVPLKTPLGGEDLGLIVRVDPQVVIEAHDILQRVRTDLGPSRAPSRVFSVSYRLPRTGQDKLDRKQILSLWESMVQSAISAA